jgi:hypothetical protein
MAMTTDGTSRTRAHVRRRADPPGLPPGPWGVLHAVIAFALEVAALGAYWYVGSRIVGGPGGMVLGLVVAAAVAVLWGAFLAPRSRRRLRWPWLPLAALGIFAVAGLGLVAVGLGPWGAVMIAVAIANAALALWLGRSA